jgi:hypothetical protein
MYLSQLSKRKLKGKINKKQKFKFFEQLIRRFILQNLKHK